MEVDTPESEKLIGFKKELQRLIESRAPLSDIESQRLKDGLDLLFSIDNQFDVQKFECFSMVLELDPLVLRPKLKQFVLWIIGSIDQYNRKSISADRSGLHLIIDLLKAFARMRRIVDLMKVYITCIVESKAVWMASEDELECLESIFVDLSHAQISDVAQFILEHLNQLLVINLAENWRTTIKLGLILRSILFSSSTLVQNRLVAEKLIIDIIDLLNLSKKSDIEYRRIISDILAEVTVKIYLAISTYEKCDKVNLGDIGQSLPIKSIGLPWKLLLGSGKRGIDNSKFGRSIKKFILWTKGHECNNAVEENEMSVQCLPGYCAIIDFWRKLLSNFGLFRTFIDQQTTEQMVEFLHHYWKDGTIDHSLKQSIIDFLSVFDVDIDRSFFDLGMDQDMAIPEEELIEQKKVKKLKKRVFDAIGDYLQNEEKMESIFKKKSIIDNPDQAIRQLQAAAFAFEYFEACKNVDDGVKEFFKDFSNRIYEIAPILVADQCKIDISISVKIIIKLIDVFSLMITDKALDLPKYPIISLALTCASMIQWDKIRNDHRIDFRKSFVSILEFLRIGTKKCNSLMITLAPNWIGILRRLQLVLFELSSISYQNIDYEDDLTSLYTRLGRFYSTLDRSKELEKISIFIIYDLVECLKKRKLTDTQRDALELGIYRLIEISDTYSIAMITAMMDDTAKELFRLMHGNYMKYYKYSGQV